jgi:hypothetical protein
MRVVSNMSPLSNLAMIGRIDLLKERHVRPYHLACIENRWYLFAFDLKRKAMLRSEAR